MITLITSDDADSRKQGKFGNTKIRDWEIRGYGNGNEARIGYGYGNVTVTLTETGIVTPTDNRNPG